MTPNADDVASTVLVEREAKTAPRTTQDFGPERFINRELSWLDFNHRVLEEAENQRHPLLERVRFLSISASNLDEFYSVRVAGLIGQAKAGVNATSPDGRSRAQILAEIAFRAIALVADQQRIWTELLALLEDAGVSHSVRQSPSPTTISMAGCMVHGAGFSGVGTAGDRSGASVSVHSQYGPGDGSAANAHRRPAGNARSAAVAGRGLTGSFSCPGVISRHATRRPLIRFILLEELVLMFLDRVFSGIYHEWRGHVSAHS